MSASPIDLVTLADAYAWLKLTSGSDDVNLQLAITGVSRAIATWCSRNFVVASYAEVYDGVGSDRLVLRNFPVISVASLSIDDCVVVPQTSALAQGYKFSGRVVALSGYRFSRGFQNIAISYQAGLSPIPEDLKLACLNWLRGWYLARDRDADLLSQRAGDTEQRFGRIKADAAGTIVAMPTETYAVLSQYRDVVPA